MVTIFICLIPQSVAQVSWILVASSNPSTSASWIISQSQSHIPATYSSVANPFFSQTSTWLKFFSTLFDLTKFNPNKTFPAWGTSVISPMVWVPLCSTEHSDRLEPFRAWYNEGVFVFLYAHHNLGSNSQIASFSNVLLLSILVPQICLPHSIWNDWLKITNLNMSVVCG